MHERSSQLASLTGNVTAQRVAARTTSLRTALLQGQALDEQVWFEMYQRTGNKISLTATQAKLAVQRELNPEQVKHVMEVETRPSVISNLFELTKPSAEQLLSPAGRALVAGEASSKKLAAKYGSWLDVDALAQIPAEEVGPRLRVLRLQSLTLSDEEVIRELRAFDDWCDRYSAAPTTWVFHQRPHILKDLVDVNSVPVRTQMAGSPHLATLTLAEQRQFAYLDHEDVTGPWLNERAYMWMAFVSNPTSKLELVKELEPWIERQTETFTGSNVVTSRLNRHPWELTNLSEPVNESQLERLLQWVAPSRDVGGKVRGPALDQLLDNPSLDEETASVLAARIDSLFNSSAWAHPEGRKLWDKFKEHWPQHYADWMEHNERYVNYWVDVETRAADKAGGDQPQNQPILDMSDSHIAFVTEHPVRWLDERLGDNEEAWANVYTLIDEIEQANFGELADLAEMTA